MTADTVNGLYEAIGGVMLWMNVRRLHRDKQVKGVSILPTAFFSSWGLWNLYFYPHLGQWLSFAGGAFLVVANVTWCGQMIYYGRARRGA